MSNLRTLVAKLGLYPKKYPTTIRFRLLGLLPLVFYIVHSIHHILQGETGHTLWICSISNLMLSIGMLLNLPILIRIAVIWIIIGIPLWIMDMIIINEIFVTSFFLHLGGVAVGIYALSHVRVHHNTWIYGMVYYLLIQHISRIFTDPQLNVNVSHSIYYGWDKIFSVYWHYWLFITLMTALVLWILELILCRLFPIYSLSKKNKIKSSIYTNTGQVLRDLIKRN